MSINNFKKKSFRKKKHNNLILFKIILCYFINDTIFRLFIYNYSCCTCM